MWGVGWVPLLRVLQRSQDRRGSRICLTDTAAKAAVASDFMFDKTLNPKP